MKNNFLSLFYFTLFLLLSSNTLSSQQMIEQNKLWSYYTDTGLIGSWPDTHPTGYTTIFTFGASEMVDNETYYRLQTSYQFDYAAFWEDSPFLMREDSLGRVFLKEGDLPEIIIYDFSLEVGDLFEDQINGCSYQLTSKDSVTLISGGRWERFNFDGGDPWIKGLGSTSFIIPNCIGSSTELLCFQTGVDMEYMVDLANEGIDLCYFIPVSTEDISPTGISIFPNPVFDAFTIQSKEEPLQGKLIIYNSMGQRVHQEEVHQTPRKEIDLSAYPTGVYYLTLGNLKQKLIKTN
jgi:hypothetical protein